MKFGKSLSNQIEETLPEWRDKFLSYKELKKRLKLIKPQDKSRDDSNRPAKRTRISGEDCTVAGGEMSKEEADFVELLEQEVEKFNSFFVEKEEEYIIKLKELQDSVMKAKDSNEEMIKIRKEIVDFHGEMVLLENYSALNYTGIVKILKKYDKRTGALLRLPFVQNVLQQPFFTTDLLYKLVKECEAMLDRHFPLTELPASCDETGGDTGGNDGGGNGPTTSAATTNVGPMKAKELAELEYMKSLYTKSTISALKALKEIRSKSSTGGLKSGFYSSTCPKAEATVRSTVETHFKNDPTVAAALLRLHFHDCFVEGCDGSILIKGSSAEMNALANLGLRGFEVIDDAKKQLEVLCPGVVSCADILALAARDSVDLSDGPNWAVPTGRRDGRVSSSSKAAPNLPSPLDSVDTQRQKFAAKGLDDRDLVTLAGAHTIGQTDCRFFRYRLYNFTTTGNSDPSLSQSALTQFQNLCPKSSDGTERVSLDKDSQLKFDVNYFKNVRDGNGVLESDQRLWGDPTTRDIVKNYAGTVRGLLGLRFDFEFKKSMVKMSSIEVKTGSQGEIRKICSMFN